MRTYKINKIFYVTADSCLFGVISIIYFRVIKFNFAINHTTSNYSVIKNLNLDPEFKIDFKLISGPFNVEHLKKGFKITKIQNRLKIT